MGLKFLFTNYL